MGKVTALTELSVPALEDLAYVVDDPGGTPASRKLTLSRLGGVFVPGLVEGRLTVSNGVAVPTSDVFAAGTLYFTPFRGNRVALYDGTRWRLYTFTQVSLALSTTTAKIYDVFLYDNAGTLTLELSAAWTNATTRADALTSQDGVLVKDGATTRLYLGTIRCPDTNQTEDSAANRFVWNYYQRVVRRLYYFDTSNTWTFQNQAAWRPANNTAGATVAWVVGAAEDAVPVLLSVTAEAYSAGGLHIAIGVDSISGSTVRGAFGATPLSTVALAWHVPPALGYHYVCWLEASPSAGGNSTVYGDNGTSPSEVYSFLGGWIAG